VTPFDINSEEEVEVRVEGSLRMRVMGFSVVGEPNHGKEHEDHHHNGY
jgi:hypothetical protein